MAVGWNRHVTEFVDTEEETDYSGGKKWDVCHAEDILCSASRAPQTLVTTSYSGEIVLWKFETGQPYGRYKTNAPTERLKVKKFIFNFKSLTETVSPLFKDYLSRK